ncbi:MAG: DUF389 domain-containing protein [Bacteroides sp.]|nr:DUF389 domain-containing protein [Bacteroides sp.]MCM1413758.1 DUF389 domain-containing protein [Bacteroides sp.]MCM1472223.1 DUF389 domain-containing protein [Bacteroides sp.]
MTQNAATKITNFLRNYFTIRSQLVPQQEAEQSIRDDVSFRGTNIFILVLAILIASLGLNTNSTAVIIGAMLISPLMGPIIGIGLGVGIQDFSLIKVALRNLVMAALFSVVASTLFFLISPVGEGHSELLARTSPTIYDVLIGFVGGGAGILAIGSRSKGNVIPGVAIATALMPPLCTAGYGLATWQLSYFFGAFYLFIINSIYIAFATFIGIKLLGYKSADDVDNQRSRRVRRIVYTLAILTMLPSIWLTINMYRQNQFEMDANNFIAHECVFPNAQVISNRAYIDNGRKIISMTLFGQPMPIDSLTRALDARLKFYDLQGAELKIMQGTLASAPAALSKEATDEMKAVYASAQATIEKQKNEIDSLQSRLRSAIAGKSAEIAPELKVVFPQITELSLSCNRVYNIEKSAYDTVNVALVGHDHVITPAERIRLKEYLEARLNLPNIDIITLDIKNKK